MIPPCDSNKALASLKSKKRIEILELLLKSKKPLYFNEITRELSLIPSTLEYHLKTLGEQGLITHLDNSYVKNANTLIIWTLLNSLNNVSPLGDYLKNHIFPIDDNNLILGFMNSNPVLIPDIISLLALMKDRSLTDISTIRLAGTFNLELEERLMRLGELNMTLKEIEIISTYENFRKFIFYENFDYFISLTDISNIKLYMVEDCNFYLGIGDAFGILFLPDVEKKLDFNQCLLYTGKNKLKWLDGVYIWLKNRSKEISLTEGFLNDKSLFDKYLKQLKNNRI